MRYMSRRQNYFFMLLMFLNYRRPVSFSEECTCRDQSISSPVVLACPLSILGVLAQQLPSTLNYINDNFDPISYRPSIRLL